MMPTGRSPSRPPGPRARFPGALVLALTRDPLGFLPRLAREYGDVSFWSAGGQPMAFVADPERIRDILVTDARRFRKGRGLERVKLLLGEGLLTSEGADHRRRRRLVQPAFHRARIAGYADTMAAYAAREVERWRPGSVIDAHAAMLRLTLAIVGRTLFDADVEGDAAEVGAALHAAVRAFPVAMLPLGHLLHRLPLPFARRFRHARETLDSIVYRIIGERHRAGGDRGDLLSELLAARDEHGGPGLTDRELRDEVMTLFLAGHETTANALTWTLHLLGEHPEAEARLHAELDAVLAGRAPVGEDAARLPYTRQVVAESMRLYPPAWIVGRRAREPYRLGAYGIPAGTIVLMSQWVTHRDPRWWPEAARFLPERWDASADDAGRPRLAYFPFGAGPRICIGEQFAWTEAVLVLAAVAQRWRLRLVPGHPVVPQPIITLRPRHGMRMRVEARV